MEDKAKENDGQLKAIHTYQADVEAAIKQKNISSTQVFVAEQTKKNEEVAKQERSVQSVPRSFNFRALLFALIFLIIGGGVIYYFVRTPKNVLPSKVASSTPEQSILTYDSYVSVPFPQYDRPTLINQIDTNKNNDTSAGVEILSFNTTSDQFLSLLDSNLSGIFLRALDPQYAFGFVRTDTSTSSNPFMIFKVNTYTSARGELLSEEGNAAYIMRDVFSIPTQNLYFKDLVIDNFDTRALVDNQNNIYFLYSFIDPTTLVFATDDATFKLIIDRITSAKR